MTYTIALLYVSLSAYSNFQLHFALNVDCKRKRQIWGHNRYTPVSTCNIKHVPSGIWVDYPEAYILMKVYTVFFDCCKQSLIRLYYPSLHPSIHPSIHPSRTILFMHPKWATANLLYILAPFLCKLQNRWTPFFEVRTFFFIYTVPISFQIISIFTLFYFNQ